MNKPIFNEKALKSVNSPEQINQHIRIIRPGYWVALIGGLALTGAFLYWCFFGNIVDNTKVYGIIFPQSGVTAVTAKCDGVADAVLVNEGETVQVGQVIWTTKNQPLLDKIELLRQQLTDAAKDKEVLQRQIDDLVYEYGETSVVKAEVGGIVQSIAPRNKKLLKGETLATIINEDIYTNDRELVAYVPMSISEKFEVGMEAQVSPIYAPREEYGFIKGYITSVGVVPVTEESILKRFGTMEYAKSLLMEDNMVELRIMLMMDNDSGNSFLWSNQKGGSLKINVGTLCNVLVVFKTFHPIELLFR